MSKSNLEDTKNKIAKLMMDDDEDDIKDKDIYKKKISPISDLNRNETSNRSNEAVQNERIIAPLESMQFPNMNSEYIEDILGKFLMNGELIEYISDDLKSINKNEGEGSSTDLTV